MSRSACIEGRATPIIETSRASMKRAPQRTSKRGPSARAKLAGRVFCRSGLATVIIASSGTEIDMSV